MNAITKPDLYTKTILTVIAACLVWLCVNNLSFLPRAEAQPGGVLSQVQIIGIDRNVRIPVQIIGSEKPLPVTATSDGLSVKLSGIKKGKDWDAIKTEEAAAKP